MIQGMLGGMVTLGWAVVLFVLTVYVGSLVFRDSLGPDPHVKVQTQSDAGAIVAKYFQTVPRSMMTVFRCSFGDCTTDKGTPLFEHVTEAHGWIWSVVFSMFLFMVVVGLFNVTSAIFVQAILASGAMLDARKRQSRLQDETRWATNFVALLRALLAHSDTDSLLELERVMDGDCTESMLEEILAVEIPRHVFQSVMRRDDDARHALTKLDIDTTDIKHLAEILDPDNNGSVGVLELVDGLMRLRGDPRRSDIIAVDLMVRSLQARVDEVWRHLQDTEASWPAAAKMERAWHNSVAAKADTRQTS